MAPHEKKSLSYDCGIAYSRIAAWLSGEGASRAFAPCGPDCWLYELDEPDADGRKPSCAIGIRPLEKRSVGRVAIERTHLSVQGDAAAVDAFEWTFTLRFISAGG